MSRIRVFTKLSAGYGLLRFEIFTAGRVIHHGNPDPFTLDLWCCKYIPHAHPFFPQPLTYSTLQALSIHLSRMLLAKLTQREKRHIYMDISFINEWKFMHFTLGLGYTNVLVSYCCFYKWSQICGLKQHKFILSQFWRSEAQNQFHWAEIKILAGLYVLWKFKGEGESISLPFPISACIPWLCSPFLLLCSYLCHIFRSLALSASLITFSALTWIVLLVRTLEIMLGPPS